MRGWNSPVYAFFWPIPRIEEIGSCHCHVFECYSAICKGKGHEPWLVRHYLDTGDHALTKNLQQHAEVCWGEETVQKAHNIKDLGVAKEEVAQARRVQSDGSITAMFLQIEGKGKVMCSHHQHTAAETWYAFLATTSPPLIQLCMM